MEDKFVRYISLQDAAKYCSYSQEYLSLRARQGKLKAVKLGRNWVTKKEWLEEYSQSNIVYNQGRKRARKKTNLKFQPVKPYLRLPTRFSAIGFRFAFLTMLVLVILITGTVLERKGLKSVYQSLDTYNIVSLNDGKDGFLTDVGNIMQPSRGLAVISIGDSFRLIGENLKGYFRWLGEKISQGHRAIVQFFKAPEKTEEEKLIPKSTEEGLVVIPSGEKDEEMKKKIRESFSDEVKVEPEDESSGIIIPVFRKGEGDKYIYILVPITGND
jgi:hypothetical protein